MVSIRNEKSMEITKNAPTISVIIPTFNRSDLIVETIESVLAQTFKDFEIIVVDNGGTDDTKRLIQQLNDQRIRYHWQPPTGRPAPPRQAVTELKSLLGEHFPLPDIYFVALMQISEFHLESSLENFIKSV